MKLRKLLGKLKVNSNSVCVIESQFDRVLLTHGDIDALFTKNESDYFEILNSKVEFFTFHGNTLTIFIKEI